MKIPKAKSICIICLNCELFCFVSRCVDASGGYLHLDPDKACRVITTCACLHNLALKDGTPHRDAEDDGYDRYRPRRDPPQGPRDYAQDVQDPVARDHRDLYAETHFQRRPR